MNMITSILTINKSRQNTTFCIHQRTVTPGQTAAVRKQDAKMQRLTTQSSWAGARAQTQQLQPWGGGHLNSPDKLLEAHCRDAHQLKVHVLLQGPHLLTMGTREKPSSLFPARRRDTPTLKWSCGSAFCAFVLKDSSRGKVFYQRFCLKCS